MRGFQSAYIGRHEFPKALAEFELRPWFTFDARVRHEIRKAFRSRYWIGAALQLGFVRMTGATLERRKARGRPVPADEILAHIAPIAFRHINFNGTYRFPIERYLDRLLSSVSAQRAASM
jgi:hypothetical protein